MNREPQRPSEKQTADLSKIVATNRAIPYRHVGQFFDRQLGFQTASMFYIGRGFHAYDYAAKTRRAHLRRAIECNGKGMHK